MAEKIRCGWCDRGNVGLWDNFFNQLHSFVPFGVLRVYRYILDQ